MNQLVYVSLPIKRSIYDLDYLSCSQKNHFGEDLSFICLDQSCSGSRLICSICQQSTHNSHTSIPLKDYLQKIVDFQNNQKKISSLVYVNELQELKSKCIQNLNQIKNYFIDTIEDLKIKTQTQFTKYYEKLMGLIKFNQENNSWIKSIQKVIKNNNVRQLNDIFQSFVEIFPHLEENEQQKQCMSITEKLNFVMQIASNQVNCFTSQLHKFSEKLKSELPKSVHFSYEDLFRSQNKMEWDPILKGKGFSISSPKIITQTISASDSQRFALTTVGFSSKQKKKVYWGFKIKKLVGWVGVGACLKKVMKSLNFKFNYNNVGHGSYLISANGYSWSHFQKTSNSTYKSFSFTTNDTVYVEFDPIGKALKFKKDESNTQYTLNIESLPQGQELCPCVNLCSVNDSVEIVSVPKNIFF